ncbi:efflux RND transporter periplasmic adaptor subunit [Telmatocola sphagniphila]|uniref:Efflux RND transporter periplasmic adaptor subunit n=1 Tax=Telmatocola sphagniphila TaxID=1123043 RepID=A0A8E6B4K8_9BACT|nr:efflux RND transporter periplasmic adaptor subunit [Telmatocola sphagniphila]QVL31334.1 efflux RND transporter periplasmic adaptor subunit [Telmatocola sphagniphila]
MPADAAKPKNESPPPAPVASKRNIGGWLRRLFALAVVASLIGGIGWRFERTAAEAPAELTLYGNIDVRQVNLAFKVAGRIDKLLVDEGDAVKSGQAIGTLEEKYFRDDLALSIAQRDQAAANYDRLKNGSRPEEIEQARAQEAEANATLKRTEADYDRSEKLRGTNAISAQEYVEKLSAYRESQAHVRSLVASRKLAEIGPRVEDISAARAQLAASEAQVVQAERRLADRIIYAPNDGIILTRAREPGAIVNAGETVFALTLAKPVWVLTYVDEPDLGAVQPGSHVTVRTDLPGGRQYDGRVGFVSPTAEFTPKNVETRELRTDLVYRVRIVVDDPDGGLRQGMPVTVSVQLADTRPRSWKERLSEALWLEKLHLVERTKK